MMRTSCHIQQLTIIPISSTQLESRQSKENKTHIVKILDQFAGLALDRAEVAQQAPRRLLQIFQYTARSEEVNRCRREDESDAHSIAQAVPRDTPGCSWPC